MEFDGVDLQQIYPAVMDDLVGMMRAQAVRLAALLGLADLVKDGPKHLSALAEATNSDQHALYRLLYALANCGYFEEVEPYVFAQTARSHVLRSDLPRSLSNFAIMHGEEWQWMPWQNALKTIHSGEPVFPEMFGKDLWSYFKEDNPEAARRFNNAMSSQSRQYNEAIAKAYDFAAAGVLADIAGGQGSFLATILRTSPDTRGILFDRPPVIETARQQPFWQGLEERVTLVSGDFFKEVPAGADTYMLKQIIHDWQDQECIQILSNCRKAMKPGGHILLVEEIVTPGKKGAAIVSLIDLQLQLLVSGRRRSEAELRALLEASGFKFARVVPTTSTYSIVEGIA